MASGPGSRISAPAPAFGVKSWSRRTWRRADYSIGFETKIVDDEEWVRSIENMVVTADINAADLVTGGSTPFGLWLAPSAIDGDIAWPSGETVWVGDVVSTAEAQAVAITLGSGWFMRNLRICDRGPIACVTATLNNYDEWALRA